MPGGMYWDTCKLSSLIQICPKGIYTNCRLRAFEIVYSDNTSTDATVKYAPQKLRSVIADTAGTDGLKAYVGFSHGDEPLESIFATDKLPHLAALKKQYDPEGLFNAYHPLPTKYP